MFYKKMSVKCSFFSDGHQNWANFRGSIGGNASQRMPAKASPTNREVIFNHKDPPIHAHEFRESWRAWPSEGCIRTLFIICTHVEIHHLMGHSKSPRCLPTFYKRSKNEQGAGARARTRDLALCARTLELGYGLRQRQRRQRPMNWHKCSRNSVQFF
jgi:hypothetical protein